MLNLIHPALGAPDWARRQASSEGHLQDTGSPDVVFPIIRFSRPVEVGLPRADEHALAHRHLDIYIDGLGATPR